MYDVVLLSLTQSDSSDCGGDCAGGCGPKPTPRVPVLACRDALTRAGARVELRTACSDREIDEVLSEAVPVGERENVTTIVAVAGTATSMA